MVYNITMLYNLNKYRKQNKKLNEDKELKLIYMESCYSIISYTDSKKKDMTVMNVNMRNT